MVRNPALLADIYGSCRVELAALEERKDLSSYVEVSRLLAKSFLLSCASFYEAEITEIARRVLQSGQHTPHVRSWLDSVAVEGQFYKWFNFRAAKNTNPFLARFGDNFKANMRALLDAKGLRTNAERDFLLLCQTRNECVHRNYAAHSMELTLGEIYAKHCSAMKYVRAVDYGARNWLMVPSSPAAGAAPATTEVAGGDVT